MRARACIRARTRAQLRHAGTVPAERGRIMEQAAHTGAPHTGDARTARTVHAVLGDRGTIGEGRRAVGYAWHAGCAAYHIAPRAAYARTTDRFTNHDVRVTWPMRAYDAEGTSPVRVGTLDDIAHVSDAMRASLARVRYVGSDAWRMRAMERAR